MDYETPYYITKMNIGETRETGTDIFNHVNWHTKFLNSEERDFEVEKGYF